MKKIILIFSFFLISCSSIKPTFKSECSYYSNLSLDKLPKFNIRKVESVQADSTVRNKLKNELTNKLKNNNLSGNNYYIDIYIISFQSSGLNKMALDHGKVYFNKKSYFSIEGQISDQKIWSNHSIQIGLLGGGGVSDNTDQMINAVSDEFIFALKKMYADKSNYGKKNCK